MRDRVTSKALLADMYRWVMMYVEQGGEPPVGWDVMLAVARRLGRVRHLRSFRRVWDGGPRMGEAEEDFADHSGKEAPHA